MGNSILQLSRIPQSPNDCDVQLVGMWTLRLEGTAHLINNCIPLMAENLQLVGNQFLVLSGTGRLVVKCIA